MRTLTFAAALAACVAISACTSAADFADDDDNTCQTMGFDRNSDQYAACRAQLYARHQSDIDNSSAMAGIVLGQGIAHAGQAYSAPPPFIAAPTMLHCFGVGAAMNCEQW